MVDKETAILSDQLMLVTVLLYLVALLGYAADVAFGRRRGTGRRTDAPASAPRQVLVGVGAAEGTGGDEVAGEAGGTAQAGAAAGDVAGDAAGETGAAAHGDAAADDGDETWLDRVHWGRFAVMITVFGWVAHLAEIITRGVAADRVPWANMYEFVSAIVFAAVTVYLVVLTRQPIRALGVFVTLAAVMGLGVAVIWLYTDVAPVIPALRSSWIAIHVTLAIISTGLFTLATVATALYLGPVARRPAWLPKREALDRIAHQTIMFAFPIWTLAIMTGAIWADEAWGRYWGWDPKETWSFVTWVVYAGYLHARATAGWRGKRAAAIALVAYGSLLFNLFGVNFLISGLHSYAG